MKSLFGTLSIITNNTTEDWWHTAIIKLSLPSLMIVSHPEED